MLAVTCWCDSLHSLTTPEAVELVQPECPSPVKLSAGQYSFSPCLMELQPLCGELLAECEMPEACQQQQRHKRRKVMPQQYLENTPPENEYEKQRQERIQRNRQIMAELGVQQAAAEIKQAMQKPKKQKTAVQPKVALVVPVPSRRSSRIAQQPVETALEQAEQPSDRPDAASLLSQEEYFKLLGEEIPTSSLKSDGSFKGWVSPTVCKMYGIADSAGQAWESNGGGSFNRNPEMSQVPAHIRAKGRSDAKAFAATMLRKNPNTYFYRHVAPNEQQAHGEWTEEEHNLFLETARKYGVGDKWGLFATYIPQRVGYQCSSYYRDSIIAKGLIIDRQFRMTPSGKAVYVSNTVKC